MLCLCDVFPVLINSFCLLILHERCGHHSVSDYDFFNGETLCQASLEAARLIITQAVRFIFCVRQAQVLALVLTVPISVTVTINVGLICAAGTRAVKGSYFV